MGGVCCVARDTTTSEGANGEILGRTIQYSPPWGVRWDNRGRVAGEETTVSLIVDQNNRLGRKTVPFFESLPEGAISMGQFGPNSQKSLQIKEDYGAQPKVHISGSPGAQKSTMEVDGTIDMPVAVDQTTMSKEPNISTVSYMSVYPLASKMELAPCCSAPSKWSPPIPESQLFQQGSSGSQLGRPSCSADKENELFGSHSRNLPQSHSRKSKSLSNELKTCMVCSKYLLERSSFSSQKIVPNNELSVVAILVCGHVYHADCLEHLTPEISIYDPPCPVCTFGEQQAMNMFEKLLKEEMEKKPKKHHSRIINSDIIPLSRLESSSSLRRSFTRPFLKRHFSFGSKASSSLSDSQHPARKRTLPWSKSTK